jgi:histidinol-phosphate aminotransferase
MMTHLFSSKRLLSSKQLLSSKRIPEHIHDLKAYQSAKSEKITGKTWLNANENPFSKHISLNIEHLNRYPDSQPEAVLQRYADYAHVDPKQLVMTRGADEGISLLIQTFCMARKDSIALFLPTYGMYHVSAQIHQIATNELSQDDLQSTSIDKLIQRIGDSQLIFICHPNNPTGSLISQKTIEALLQALPQNKLLIIDEAYIEFCSTQTCVHLIHRYNNIIILRTLSKAFALAGLRCGFLLGDPSLMAVIKKVLPPYPISTVVAEIAKNALSLEGIASMQRQVGLLNNLKKSLKILLKTSHAVEKQLPSHANFIMIKLKKTHFLKKALNMGLIMRPLFLYHSDQWLRISIGNRAELDHVASWLNQCTFNKTLSNEHDG